MADRKIVFTSGKGRNLVKSPTAFPPVPYQLPNPFEISTAMFVDGVMPWDLKKRKEPDPVVVKEPEEEEMVTEDPKPEKMEVVEPTPPSSKFELMSDEELSEYINARIKKPDPVVEEEEVKQPLKKVKEEEKEPTEDTGWGFIPSLAAAMVGFAILGPIFP